MRVQPSLDSLAIRGPERSSQSPQGSDSSSAEVQAAPVPQRPELNDVISKMNKAVSIFDQALQFKVADGNRIIVKLIDTATGEVLKEIPPEKLVEAFKNLGRAIGLLIDRKV